MELQQKSFSPLDLIKFVKVHKINLKGIGETQYCLEYHVFCYFFCLGTASEDGKKIFCQTS